MSFIDILDKLEKLGVIESAEDWFKIRELRKPYNPRIPRWGRGDKKEFKSCFAILTNT